MKSRVFEIIAAEQARQNSTVELIASENFVSENVMKAVGSCLTNKYSEGYPAQRPSGNRGRFYGGCQYVDELEEYCCRQWQAVFQTGSISFVFSIQEGVAGIQINILAQSVRTVQLYALQSCFGNILVRHNLVAINARIQILIIISQFTCPVGADQVLNFTSEYAQMNCRSVAPVLLNGQFIA